MRDDYDKLKKVHVVNLTFHISHIGKLESDSQSMTVVCNDLQQQLRVVHLQKSLEIEEYEKLLQNVNKHTVVIDTDEEDESFPCLPRSKTSMQNHRELANTRAVRQQANSTELPGHDNAASVLPKVTHCVSEILHPIHTVEEEVVQR